MSDELTGEERDEVIEVLGGFDEPNWEGFEDRECGEHRTVGSRRAWCFEDSEWCYRTIPCRGCELPILRARIIELEGDTP